MSSIRPSTFLRAALIGDAAASGATGLLMFAGGGFLTSLLGLPENLLRYAGLFLLPYAAFVAWLGIQDSLSRGAVWPVVISNALWAADSLLLLVVGWVTPTALGLAFVTFQAVVAAASALAQYVGLHRAPSETVVANG